jgi:hypothetical protein
MGLLQDPLRKEPTNILKVQELSQESINIKCILKAVLKKFKLWLSTIHTALFQSICIVSILFLQGNFKELEDSAETSIAVFFGLQGIPNALEDPQNPKVR